MVKFVIDAGHGGKDPGAVGNGLQEKNITLNIALKIRDILSRYENTQVKLTRDSDVYLTLSERVNIANAWGADYFMSIHVNSAGAKTATGFETFVFPNMGGATVANQNIIHSEIMKLIQDIRDRGKKTASYQVIRDTRMPAILTENLFISNKSDAAKLNDESFLNKLAQGHANGLIRAYGLKAKPSTITVKKESIELPKRDINKVSDWAKDEWEKAQANGYFDGTRPGDTITREEAAIVTNRIVDNIREYIVKPLETRVDKLEKELENRNKPNS